MIQFEVLAAENEMVSPAFLVLLYVKKLIGVGGT